MNIEEFYDADPRRRSSDEVNLGREWLDGSGRRYELNWVVDTGELYLMAEPSEPVEMDPLGDSFVPDMPVELITVEILATIAERADLDATLADWAGAMEEADGVDWIRSRLDQA
jgi:hypothetical protein